MMRKVLISVILLVFIAIHPMTGQTLTTSSIEYQKELPGGSSRIIVEFPVTEDSQVRRAIIDYIFEICKSIHPGVKVEQPANTCDEPAFKKYLETYTETLCRLCAEDQHDYAKTFGEDGSSYQVQWFSNFYIAKTADTDLYVSYAAYHGSFAGGAHDERGSGAITLRKADGTRIDSIFVDTAEENMQPLLWKYLIASEKPENEKEYISEINKFLKANYNITDYLHLPFRSIYLAPDGVHIMYQPLEICFWPDEPELVIPYEAAKPFLTKAAIQLISNPSLKNL